MSHIVDSTITRPTWQHTADRIALAVAIFIVGALALAAGIHAGSIAAGTLAVATAITALIFTFTMRAPIPAHAR